jgi:hypothetical protein
MGEKHLPQAFCLKEACKKNRKEKKNGEVICQSSMEENQAAPTDDGPKTMLNAATRTD